MDLDPTKDLELTQVSLDTEELDTPPSRRAFLAKLMAGAAGATVLAAGPATVFAGSTKLAFKGAQIPSSDASILNFALTLEHLEANFYNRAASRFGTSGTYVKRLINVLRFDENAHVNALTQVLKNAGYKPVGAAKRYRFGNALASQSNFLKFAVQLEDTGVHAYHGQVGNIRTPQLVITAAEIATVEARHTGAIRSQLHRDPTDGPLDIGLTRAQILKIVAPLIG